ncbi:MAG: ABC transporter permease [Planctomycetes bacterium]|nr:ABC transporter permease [Planctomycetota bacterium]
MRRLLRVREFHLALVIVALAASIGIANPAFLSLSTLYDLLKSCVVPGLFALGVLVVLVSGGIDISFTAIGIFSLYAAARILEGARFPGAAACAFLLAASIGTALGAANAGLISRFRLPALIVTLGTAGAFRGAMLAFLGTAMITGIPEGLVRLARFSLFRRTLESGETIGLSIFVVILGVAAIAVHLFLRHTMLGRCAYAMGGNLEAAERAGFSLGRARLAIYGGVGFLSGIAGLAHGAMMRNADPFDLVGTELTVIAAAVLGGASITGGRGSVLGTLLGVFLIAMINNSLIFLGVPPYWKRAVVGLVIIASIAISAQAGRRMGGSA